MPLPVIHINITASVVAAYAAVVSTFTGLVQGSNYLRDRAHLKIRVQPNMKMTGGPGYDSTTLTIMFVDNAGRRPVTITSVGAFSLFPHAAFLFMDVKPPCPCELTEGKQLIAFIPQKDLDLSVIESWEAYTTGRTFRLPIVPWYR